VRRWSTPRPRYDSPVVERRECAASAANGVTLCRHEVSRWKRSTSRSITVASSPGSRLRLRPCGSKWSLQSSARCSCSGLPCGGCLETPTSESRCSSNEKGSARSSGPTTFIGFTRPARARERPTPARLRDRPRSTRPRQLGGVRGGRPAAAGASAGCGRCVPRRRARPP